MDIEQIVMQINSYLLYLVLGLAVLVIILMVMVCINGSKLKKIQHRYEAFMSKEDINLEELLVQYTKKLNSLLQYQKDTQATLSKIESSMKTCVQKVGIVRYKALANVGADLSFAIALLDEQNNGIVLNGIYGRESSYTYAKPIVDGKSTYNLSEEEEEAIKQAIEKAAAA